MRSGPMVMPTVPSFRPVLTAAEYQQQSRHLHRGLALISRALTGVTVKGIPLAKTARAFALAGLALPWATPASAFTANIAAANPRDRKSTRLNSSHHSISYAVFC